MFWILFYDLVDDYVERRAPLRNDHLTLARSLHEQGVLLMAGAVADPVDGAALVFRTADRFLVEQFVRDDPYVKNGLVTSWRIRQWSVVVGND
jgi:uncharacterized protein